MTKWKTRWKYVEFSGIVLGQQHHIAPSKNEWINSGKWIQSHMSIVFDSFSVENLKLQCWFFSAVDSIVRMLSYSSFSSNLSLFSRSFVIFISKFLYLHSFKSEISTGISMMIFFWSSLLLTIANISWLLLLQSL